MEYTDITPKKEAKINRQETKFKSQRKNIIVIIISYD
jgi:hypothetical protein